MSEKLENNRYSADLGLETSVENMRRELDWLGSQVDVIHWRCQVNYTAVEINVANFSHTKTWLCEWNIITSKMERKMKSEEDLVHSEKDNMCVLMCRG